MPNKITLSVARVVFVVVATIATWGLSLGISFGIAQQQIWTMRGEMDAMKSVQQLDHDSLTEIKTDVKWMRKRMERNGD